MIYISNTSKELHCLAVAKYMFEKAANYGLDPEKMFVLGLLHDIGYLYGRKEHELTGSELLSQMGFSNTYIDAIRNHGTSPYGLPDHNLTSELFLLQQADMSVNAKGDVVTFEERLCDIKTRYGSDSDQYLTAKDIVMYQKENKGLYLLENM